MKISRGFVSDKDILKFGREVKKNSKGTGTNRKNFNPGSGLIQYGHGWSKRASRKGGRVKGRRKRNRQHKKAIARQAKKTKTPKSQRDDY